MNMNPEPLGTNYDVRIQYQTLNPFKKMQRVKDTHIRRSPINVFQQNKFAGHNGNS
jgi:hypothetical protein